MGDRLQLWAGLVPLAGYLVVHLLSQASALWGPFAHAAWVGGSPWLIGPALEVAFIYAPLALYVGLGLVRLARRSRAENDAAEGASGATASSLVERWIGPASGAVLLVFLLVHVAEYRLPLWMGTLLPSDYYSELCASLSSTRWGGVPAVAIGYLIGLAAAALHAAHGLYRGALHVGLVGVAGERRWARCCGAFGVGLFGLGALIVIDLATGSVLIHLSGS